MFVSMYFVAPSVNYVLAMVLYEFRKYVHGFISTQFCMCNVLFKCFAVVVSNLVRMMRNLEYSKIKKLEKAKIMFKVCCSKKNKCLYTE